MTQVGYVGHLKCLVADSGRLEIDQIGAGVGVLIHSPKEKTAVWLHVMDVYSPIPRPQNLVRYANTAIPYALALLGDKGARSDLQVAIAGGAGLAKMPKKANIGPRIVSAVKDALLKAHLSIGFEQTGGSEIRKMTLDLESKKIEITPGN